MAISIKSLKNQRRPIEFNYFDESGVVTYNPGAITERLFDDVRNAVSGEDENALNQILSAILVEWDVVDEMNVMVPLRNEDGPAPELREIPIPFKSAVLSAVMEDVQGNQQRSAGRSADTSQRKGK